MKFSICIPTFSRRRELLATLAAVSGGLPADAEVVVSDNGSRDGTVEAVCGVAAAFPAGRIRLVTHEENVGFDRNVLDAVANARGEYCWLLGDDDVPRPGALARVMAELGRQPSVVHLLLNYARRDAATGVITKEPMVALFEDACPATADDFFFLRCPAGSYFRRLGTNVITMSTNIVHRECWLRVASDAEQFIGCNMIHVFVIAAMLAGGGRTRFIAAPQVDYLCNNQRAWSNDVWSDYRVRVYGWLAELGYDPMRLAAVAAEDVTHRTWRDMARAIRDRLTRRSRHFRPGV